MLRVPFIVAIVALASPVAAAEATDDVQLLDPSQLSEDALAALGLSSVAITRDHALPASIEARIDSAGVGSDTLAATPRWAGARIVRLTDLSDLPVPLLPDGALLIGLATSEDLEPYRGDLVFARAAMPFAPPPLAPHARLAEPAAAPAQSGDMTTAPATSTSTTPHDDRAAPARTQLLRAEATTTSTARIVATAGAVAGVLALVGFALYHRIRPNAALENDTRKSIFDAVCQNPGLGVHAIASLAGVSYSTATYHLERLVGAGMLVMTPDGNKLCYYKNGGAFSESERKILPIVKNEEAAKLLEAILDTPGTYRAALAERLGVTATIINWHLRRLRDAGLVHETRQGRNAYLYANTDALRTSIASLATKLSDKDAAVAERLRGYVAQGGGPAGAAAPS